MKCILIEKLSLVKILMILDCIGDSKIIFANAEQQSEWYTKRITSLLLGFVCTLILTASITISSILSAKGYGPEAWMVPYKAM